MSKLVTHTIKTQAATLRTKTLDGRTYTVVPATIIVAGVLNGELVPADELAFNPSGWNGRPIVMRHPQDDAGNYIVANDPSVIETKAVGQFFNAQFNIDRITGEMWLDVEKIQRLGGDALTVLQRIQNGEIVEVSTGYFAGFTEITGEFNGQSYSAIQNSIIPDHIALLPDEIGACSVAAGCGANRYNTDAAGTDNHNDSVMIAFFLRPQDAQALALSPDALPGGSVLPANELHVTLACLGDLQDVACEFNSIAGMLTGMTEYAMMVMAQTFGMARFSNPETGTDAIVLLLDSEQLHQFRDQLCDWLCWDVEISRLHGFIPHVTLGYIPSDTPLEMTTITPTPLVFDQVALSWGSQTLVFDLNGELRDTSPDAITVNCKCSQEGLEVADKEREQAKVTKKIANEEVAEVAAVVELPAIEAVAQYTLPAELTELVEAVKAFGGVAPLMDAVKGIKANADRQHAELVAKLTANAKCAFSADELKAMSLDALTKVQRMIAPVDYSGQAGFGLTANADSEEWEPYQSPVAAK